MTKKSELLLEYSQPISCEKVMDEFGEDFPQTEAVLKQCGLAKNGVFVGKDATLNDGDELALLPPVSGG